MTLLHISQPIQVLFATLFLMIVIIFGAQDLICNVGATSRGLGAGGLAVLAPPPPPPAIKITKLAMRGTLLASKQVHPPSVKLPSSLVLPKPKSSHFRANRYKFTETEAFRPTAPGKSPGAGHESPPTAL